MSLCNCCLCACLHNQPINVLFLLFICKCRHISKFDSAFGTCERLCLLCCPSTSCSTQIITSPNCSRRRSSETTLITLEHQTCMQMCGRRKLCLNHNTFFFFSSHLCLPPKSSGNNHLSRCCLQVPCSCSELGNYCDGDILQFVTVKRPLCLIRVLKQ